jgi:glycerol uptake facilitator-like aquaporin
MITRRKLAMVVAEFLGTALLALVILAVSKSTIGIPYFVAIAAGLTLVMAVMVLGRISGAHLNPAITLGLLSVRRIQPAKAVVYLAAQFLGGAAAYLLFTYLVGQTWSNTGEFQGKVLVAEATGALIFSLGWAATVYAKLDTARSAAVIGVSLVLGIIVAAAGSGGIVNPAVALGARSWVWGTFVLGPILGSIIGFNLYSLLFAPTDELVEKAPVAPAKKK